jgi:hypothetical protein
MPLQATSGAASYDAFGGGVPVVPNYIEDVFSTYLYTGTGATQTITNNIDLSTKGGLIWIKDRVASGLGVDDHYLQDTARGVRNPLFSNLTNAQLSNGDLVTSVSTTGFVDAFAWPSNNKLVSWTFRKQPKFFDVVTYTGTGSNTTIAHNLGSTPGCIIIKRTNAASPWSVYHRGLTDPSNAYIVLNTTDARVGTGGSGYWNATAPTSTNFSLSGDININNSGSSYVAYIFAHDAGGFGLTSTDNVITCGSYIATDPAPAEVTLGYEPQFVLVKDSTNAGQEWTVVDNMRGMSLSGSRYLFANSSGAEAGGGPKATATGFIPDSFGSYGARMIYIAIRRGPMKVPTSGTSVFGLSARSGTGANATVTGGQTDDAVLIKNRGSAVASLFSSRLTGTGYLVTSSTAAEVAAGTTILQANPWDVMDGVKVGTTSTITNASSNTYINYLFKRAPSFFDEVCYTGTGTAGQTFNHNLGVVPEMMIVKNRTSGVQQWRIYHSFLGATKNLSFQGSAAATSTTIWNDTAPTSSVFSVGTAGSTNDNTSTFVAYLFATCAGVSKVGSYTGTATTLQIDCGFTAGARFILIKRTDSTGDYYVWDTARGIVAGDDPYFLLNGTAAEVTNTDYIDTYSAGFEISSTAPAVINASGGTYIFLAIA